MSDKDKPTLLLAIKTYSFDVGACHLFYTCRLFLYNVDSLQVYLQVISLSHP